MIYKWCAILCCCFVWSCKEQPTYKVIQGQTMGTTYSIQYNGVKDQILKYRIDSLLIAINASVSTYEPESDISRFNTSASGLRLEECQDHFIENTQASFEIQKLTQGAFDPTVMPLVNYWGFGTTGKYHLTKVDSAQIDSIRSYIGLSKITFTKDSLTKSNPKVALDYSAIAKGYGVDRVCQYVEARGCSDYYVEIGGELRTQGHNGKGRLWTVGINTPNIEAGLKDAISYVQLDDCALASSGNYRNFYFINNKMYGHSIDPTTGYPVSSVLSASIIAEDCMTADALATACMVHALDTSMTLIESQKNTEALFVYLNEDGEMAIKQTSGFHKYRIDE